MRSPVGAVPPEAHIAVEELLREDPVWRVFMLYSRGDEWWCNIMNKTKQPGDEGRFMRLKVPAGDLEMLLAKIGIML